MAPILELGGSVLATMTDGNGMVYLANGEKPNRFPVMNHTRIKVLTLMGWNKTFNEETQEIPSDLKKQFIGTYNDFLYGQGMETKIVEKNNRLYVESMLLDFLKGKNENELLYLKNGTFRIVDYPNVLNFNFSNGKVNSVILTRGTMKTEVQMIKK